MRRLTMLTLVLLAVLVAGQPFDEVSRAAPKQPASGAFDTTRRVLWTTSNITGSPDPDPPYRIQQVFPNLKFFEPLAIAAVPGTNRFLVAERKGKILSFENRPDARAEPLIDLERTIYGVTAHPEFSKNGLIYVSSIVDPTEGAPKGSRVSAFTVQQGAGWKCQRASEKVIFEWPSGGHNGGCMAFGKDGYLYLATGDGSGIADELKTGQNLADHLASLLRLDVNQTSPGRNYAVPADNPFVGQPGARPEIWAYGLRQLWKFSFDRETGDLWGGDVGQDLWEMVYKIEKGGNYGWSVMEGAHEFRPERPRGPTPILKPIFEHPHSDFRSITGGYVYRGAKHKALVGAYVYGDYDTGKVHALKYENGKVAWQKELVDTPLRIVSFAEDQAGEIYLLDFMNGTLYELTPAPAATARQSFPRKLSETGLFDSTRDHVPAPGLIPYSVNAELWSDHAIKERFLALPGEGTIEFDTVEYPQPAPGAPRGWRFPDGTVVVKTFSMEMEAGNPGSRRRLETRILHFEQLAGSEEVGDQVWRGYTYVWNDDQSDAILLDAPGLDRELTIKDPRAPGGIRKQTWHFPSRSECTLCHTMPAKYVLGLNTLQLNKVHDYGGTQANQLEVFQRLGLFKKNPPKPAAELPRLRDYKDATATLDQRARSYLHANCAHCHMKWGGGNAEFQLLATLPLEELGIIGTRPGQGGFGLKDPAVLVPGDPERSMIYHRMTRLGLGRMPHVASNVIDEPNVKLLAEWIRSLPAGAGKAGGD